MWYDRVFLYDYLLEQEHPILYPSTEYNTVYMPSNYIRGDVSRVPRYDHDLLSTPADT
jgi:hypothetical protein